jgi:hypothetical protein
VSKKRWSADHGLQATDTLTSLVDRLALITQRINFLKGGRAVATVNLANSEAIHCICVPSSVSLSVDADCLKPGRR